MTLVLFAVALLLASGALALALGRSPTLSTTVGAAGAFAGCAIGLWAPIQVLLVGSAPAALRLPWGAPTGDLLLGLDALSAFFLAPLFVLSALAAVYGREYLLAYRDRKGLGPPTFYFNLLVASMAVVVTARGAVLFLVAWEVMTLAAYFLVSFDDREKEVQRAGWVYLVASHVGVACLLALFLLLDRQAKGLSFEAFQAMPAPSPGLAMGLFVLAVVGFGVKAGFVPLHVWLPEAHAAAPSHVSALMSGVLIKLGLYGVLRTLTFLPLAPWWGPALVAIGLTGAVLGITLALYQRDLKRVLAYSSIENVGLITLGLGVALWAMSQGAPKVAAFGALGALLHLWNHTLMKGLLFFSAGSVLHATGTKDLERLGGLMKRMPRTGPAMLLGAVAIAGLPPLNAFVSEWLIYLGLIQGGLSGAGSGSIFGLFAVGLLSLVGGLTALCFVRLAGVALLGQPRSEAAGGAHEASSWMTGPTLTLAAGAVLMSLFPGPVSTALVAPIGQLFGPEVAAQVPPALSSLATLGTANFALWVGLGTVGLLVWHLTRSPAPPVGTWDCGYAAPTPRMQYTARSFSELLTSFLPSFLRPRVEQRAPTAYFPADGGFSTDCPDPLTRGVYEPFIAGWADRFARLRWLQQGSLHMYLLYILVMVVLTLAWASWQSWGSG